MTRWATRYAVALLVLACLVAVLVGLRVSTVRFERACAADHPQQKMVEVDGTRLHFVAAGEGAPVVLLHGDGGSALDFTTSPVFERLAEHHRVIAIDRPGHGYSDDAATPATLHGQAALVRAALRNIGVEEPVLVGHSRGASVVAAYLTAYPDEVAAAVSIGGDLWGEPDPGAYGVYRPASWPLVGPLLADVVYAPATRFDDYRLLRSGLDRAFAPEGPAPDRYVEAYACRWVSASNLHTTLQLMEDTDAAMPAIRRDYGQLDVPVVIVHGADDGNVEPQRAIRAHELLARSELRMLEGAGHMPHVTRPTQVVRAVEDAIEQAALDVPR